MGAALLPSCWAVWQRKWRGQSLNFAHHFLHCEASSLVPRYILHFITAAFVGVPSCYTSKTNKEATNVTTSTLIFTGHSSSDRAMQGFYICSQQNLKGHLFPFLTTSMVSPRQRSHHGREARASSGLHKQFHNPLRRAAGRGTRNPAPHQTSA